MSLDFAYKFFLAHSKIGQNFIPGKLKSGVFVLALIMSKHETWRTRKFWEITGGLLIEEYLAIPSSKDKSIGKRVIDGVIVLGEPTSSQVGGSFDFKGRDIIAVQTKANRLGMYLMGQAYFSREILKRFKPKSISTVAICAKGDVEMEKLCQKENIDVVIIPESEKDIL